jgi:signal transduction histidine kinase
VVEEYAILRQCIIDLVHHESAPAMRSAQLARLHSGIDRAIVTSTARYHEASERTLRALDRISSAALTHRDPEKMLPELLKVLLETCASVDAASLLLLEGDLLRVHAAFGIGLENTIGEVVPVGASLAGRVAQTRSPVSSRDAANDPLITRQSIRRSGLRGYYGVPLTLGEDLIGVATIGSRSTAEFSDEDRLLFRSMSGRAAALIAQARLNAELARRNAELAAALEYRDRILGVLSHDLRNPLGVILMSADLLDRGGPLSERQRRTVQRVANNARRVDRMVRDLLDYTQARQGQALPVSPRKGDLLTLCHQVMDGLQVLHPRVELRCTAEGRTDGWFDPERAIQVVSNLVTNAIVHGEVGAPVGVVLRGTDHEVWMEVHNQGSPIPESLLPYVFDAFRRGGGAAKAATGLGLGLFISQQIVAGHGGSIEVRSKEGEGTTFRVRWPRRESPPAGA